MFNWLVKKVPYTVAIVILTLLWTDISSAIFGGGIIFIRGQFTSSAYLVILAGVVAFFSILVILEHTSVIKFKGKDWKVLNKNIKDGRVNPSISNKELLGAYRVLENMNKWILQRYTFNTVCGLFIVALTNWFIDGNVKNAFIIFFGGGLAISWSLVGSSVFHELMTMGIRREAKIMLVQRNIPVKETSFSSIKNNFRLFMLLLLILLGGIILVVPSLKMNTIFFMIVILLVVSILYNDLLNIIYNAFSEIEKVVKDLVEGRETVLFSGSLDREIIDLFGIFRESAKEIKMNRKALEEAKAALEVKVKDRIKELKELAAGLDQKVAEKTQELREKIVELEKFQKVSSGRELKMSELKKKLSALKKSKAA